jgi:hypothetical protein
MRVIQARYALAGAVVAGVLMGACGGSTAESGSAAGSAGVGGSAGASGSAGSGGAGGAGGVGRTPEKHRPSATACDNVRPVDDPMVPDAGNSVPCRTHADCTEGQNGRCSAIGRGGWVCTYDECFTDADCGAPGGVCACGGSSSYADNNVCLSGDCKTDADCGAAGFCSPTFGSCGSYSGVVSYYCHTPQDECVDDADCGGPAGYCAYVPAARHWKCSNAHCVG